MSFEEKNVKAELCLHEHDHRELNKKHHYYYSDENIGAGLPLWLPAGVVLRDELEKFARELEFLAGFQRVVSPHIAKEDLYHQSGHLPYYEESMFPPIELENVRYRLRPMCCPHHHKIYSSHLRSYRDLPLRLAEYGQVYRYERSGVLSGLMRARGLCQNDAHLYCRPDQVKDEIKKVLQMYQEAYRILGISEYRVRLSKWGGSSDGKYVPFPEKWAWAEGVLRDVLIELQWPFNEEEGEAAFYGPKIDIQLKNIYGKEESVSTVQLDFISAERFNLSYIDENGKAVRPLILHRAPLGSHERMVSFLIEKYKGAFPLWLSPMQVKILPIAERHFEWGKEVQKALHNAFVRVELDERIESLSKKVAEAQAEQVPYVLVIGDREVQERSVSIRKRGEEKSIVSSLNRLLEDLKEQIKKRSV
ncbi:threonine--tRNA ligase [Bdellovibrio sp. HCB-162]|uniref:threonine--tRNA ligase n=1 Tax=Bdellovibrio sp. HCB-162 TaxID=3394234 RepID=UPI0039BC2957